MDIFIMVVGTISFIAISSFTITMLVKGIQKIL